MKKRLSILEYELPVTIAPLKEGGFLATTRKLQGCLAEGKTIAGALANMVDVAAHIIDIRREEGMNIPLKTRHTHRTKEHLSFSLPVPYAIS